MAACNSCGSPCIIMTERSFTTTSDNNDVHLDMDVTQTPNVLTATLQVDASCVGNLLKNTGDGWCVQGVGNITGLSVNGTNLVLSYIGPDGQPATQTVDASAFFTDINVQDARIETNPVTGAVELVIEETDGQLHRVPIQRWRTEEITDADLATAGSPTSGDVATYAANNNLSSMFIYYIGNGTADDPDYVYIIDENGAVTNTESPAAPINTTTDVFNITDGANPFLVSTEDEVLFHSSDNSINVDTSTADEVDLTACNWAMLPWLSKKYTSGASCDFTNATELEREDFSTPSTGQGTGLGSWLTEFTVSENGQPPNWGQLYAEGVYRVMDAAAAPPAPQPPGIHSGWLTTQPFGADGYAAFNLAPMGGVADLKILYKNINVVAGNCYRIRFEGLNMLQDLTAGDPPNVGLYVGGVKVADTGDITANTPSVYTAEFTATSTGPIEFALRSNTLANAGNDLGINYIAIDEVAQTGSCETATVHQKVDCDFNLLGDKKYFDAAGTEITETAFNNLTAC